MNLFIGPNGSGKSNIIRILGDLSIDYHQRSAAVPRSIYQGEPPQNALVSTAQLGRSFISNRIPQNSFRIGTKHLVRPEYVGDLKILYDGHQQVQSHGRVHFESNFPKVLAFKNASLTEGTISDWIGVSGPKTVTSDLDEVRFAKLLGREADHFQENGILIFGLRYIFRRDFIVGADGYFDELHSKVAGRGRKGSGGAGGFHRELWPDGVLRVAKIIAQLRRMSASVALLEEPELGLEPRVVRRFVEFLLWLGTPQPGDTEIPRHLKKVEEAWKLHVDDLQRSRKDPVKMGSRHFIQYFLTSHSSVMLSKILEIDDVASVYEFSSFWEDSSYNEAVSEPGEVGKVVEHKKGPLIEQETLWSKVRRVQSEAHTTLNSLGASGADLLQCNGVVWVEGPSDVIYITSWLELYADEFGEEKLKQGHHYEFQMYGGAILDSLSLQSDDASAAQQNTKLVEMFSFSRNAYVVMDSDAVKSADDKVVDRSNFSKAKKFIQEQFEQLSSSDCSLGLWYPEGDIKLKTIEEYLDTDSLLIAKSATKKIAAEKRTQSWANGAKKMSDFPEAKIEVTKLHSTILGWQP